MVKRRLSKVVSVSSGATNRRCGCLVAGYLCADSVVTRKRGPMPEKNELALGTAARFGLGGPGYAAALALLRYGAEVKYTGVVGADTIGEITLRLMKEAGVDTSAVVREGCGSLTNVIVDQDASRRFFVNTGANALLTGRHISRDAITNAAGFYVSGIGLHPKFQGKPCGQLLKFAVEKHVMTGMDLVNPGAMRPRAAYRFIAPSLSFLDVLFISMAEAEAFTGKTTPEEVIRFLRRKMDGFIVLKNGKKGMVLSLFGHQELIYVPAFRIKAKDETGAGDTSAAVMFHVLVEASLKASWNPRTDLIRAAEIGCAVGAMVAERGQGASASPSAAEVQAFIRKHGKPQLRVVSC